MLLARGETQMSDNPMHRCNAAPRCGAKSKRSGLPCQSPAVRGHRVCRMHGARGGAPDGKRKGNFRWYPHQDATDASRYVNAPVAVLSSLDQPSVECRLPERTRPL
jgi:hypothetical protein